MQVLTPQQFADRLMTTSYPDGETRTMRPGSSGIAVNLTDLTAQEKGLARAALAEIASVTGLRFAETTGSAQIRYSNDGSGAQTQTWARGDTITRADVRIASDRVAPGDGYGSFAFRTYVHETLHALGLGHPQDYGTVREFSQSSVANDSWQISLMSYFDQTENTWVDADKAYHLTPMMADHLALRQMYDAPAMRVGNTTYGVGSTAGGALDRAAPLGQSEQRVTFLVADHGGVDHVNFAGFTAAQRINLAAGAISDVMGALGNMQIATGTVIEHATGGAGADTLVGNSAANRLAGGNGADRLYGRAGADALQGGDGRDTLAGEDGNDRLFGGRGDDRLLGGAGNDSLFDSAGANLLDGGAGNDSLSGGAGPDQMLGGAGRDTLTGGLGADRISGGDGNDWLRGGAGADTLIANAGADVLDGGAGNDLLRGGAGRDRFVFTSGADRVQWFDPATDVIDLRGLAGLDSWADVRARLTLSGDDVVFRLGDYRLTIEDQDRGALDATNVLW